MSPPSPLNVNAPSFHPRPRNNHSSLTPSSISPSPLNAYSRLFHPRSHINTRTRYNSDTSNQPLHVPSNFTAPLCPPRTGLDLKVMTINARSLGNKIGLLLNFCMHHNPSILCITETWMTPSKLLSVPGYTYYRRDRPTQDNKKNRSSCSGYGGVAILTNNSVLPSVSPCKQFQRDGTTIKHLVQMAFHLVF